MAISAFKFRLYPTKEQETLLSKHFGSTRWVYNYGLEAKTVTYQKDGKGISLFDVSKRITEMKKEEETAWLKEVNSQSLQSSLRNLDIAFANFFSKKAKYPKFKSRNGRQSFSCPQKCRADFGNGRFYCPKFRDGIRAVFHREFKGEVGTCTVSRDPSGKYFVSVLVDNGLDPKPIETPTKEKCLGIDLGLIHCLTDSDGRKVENPRHLKKKLKTLRRQQRQLSRKKKGGVNREKQRCKLSIIYEKVTNSRKDFLHKLTHEIAENQGYNCVAMETLGIQNMMKNKRVKLARHIGDAAWFTFQAFLEYKLQNRGKTLIKIGQFEPSSKLCSCGHLNSELKLGDREWTCTKCGETHDRDVLAANNIRKFAFQKQNFSREGLSRIHACGDSGYRVVEAGSPRIYSGE